MTMPWSGPISLRQANYEVYGIDGAYILDLNNNNVRKLAGKLQPSAVISMSDLYGKSWYIPMSLSFIGTYGHAFSISSSGTVECSPEVRVSDGTGPFTYTWSFVSNPDSLTLSNTSNSACRVSRSYTRYQGAYWQAILRCVVRDSTGATVQRDVGVDLVVEGNT